MVLSLLLNVVAIPYLAWRWWALHVLYHRNVDYCSELAYAVGFHQAKGNDLKEELSRYPTRLTVTSVSADAVEALIGPAKHQYPRLEFNHEAICNAYVFTKRE